MSDAHWAGHKNTRQNPSPATAQEAVLRRTAAGSGAAATRLSNLAKLFHVPVFALRELLESRSPGQAFGHLRQAELVKSADEMPAIAETDVDELYENYRYGGRLTFYLYLLPSGLVDPEVGELQGDLGEVIARERPCRMEEACGGPDYECEACPRQIILLDEEDLDGFHEIRFRYYVTHRFLNADEHPDEVLQSRYGFLWLDLSVGYLVILARDEPVNGLLTQALAQCLRAIPMPVRFPKELLDKHFSIERAKHLSYYDPGTGVRRSISGDGLWQRFGQEIMSREQQYARSSSLYDEEVAQGLVSGLGVTSSKGRIYLTRTLPTSVVRAWARQRLPDLMRDVRALRAYQPDSLGHSTETVQQMRLPSAGRAAVNTIVEALLQTDQQDLTSVSLPQSAIEIFDALAGRYFNPYVRAQCDRCDQSAELCPDCESPNLDFKAQSVTCQDCGSTLSDKQTVTLRCMNGHITPVSLSEAWCIAPNHWLQKRITRIFAELGQTWDERNDYFHIEGNTLYRLRRGRMEKGPLPPVVQTYISNFWDPITGQVHTGGGDILNTQGSNGDNQTDTSVPASPKLPVVTRAIPEKPVEETMRKREDIKPTVTYTPTFHGPIYGPTHAGSGDIRVGGLRYGLDARDLGTLFASLRSLVEEQAPPEKKQEALQAVNALKEAVKAEKPNVSKMEGVLDWFKKNVPQLAGAVASVIVNPIVGTVVQAAGEVAAQEFRHRFA